MNILVLNCGSSSLSWKLFEVPGEGEPLPAAGGRVERIGPSGHKVSADRDGSAPESLRPDSDIGDHRAAAAEVFRELRSRGMEPDAVGHRFVHGGTVFPAPAVIGPETLEKLRECLPLAPLHNPLSLAVIEAARERYPALPQYACFDTSFHSGLLPQAAVYAVPRDLARRFGLRKFGFHGLSYQSVVSAAARFLEKRADGLRLVACHLGTGGSSAAAIAGGRSLDTSMGFSPLQGLVMATRSGDMDPEAVLALVRSGMPPGQVSRLLNRESGLLGLSGYSGDLGDLLERRHLPDEGLAVAAYFHRLRLYIGAYLALLGGADALIFTDEIGLIFPEAREEACRGLEFAGVRLDPDLNRRADGSRCADVSAAASRVRVLVVPNDEELEIAREGVRLLIPAEEGARERT